MPDPTSIRLILTIAGCAMTVLVVFRPALGVTAYLIIMVVRPGIFFPALGAVRIELLVGVGLLAYGLFSGRLPRLTSRDAINKSMFLVVGVMLLSMVQAIDFSNSLDWMIEFGKIVAFYIMVVTMLNSRGDIKMFLWVFGLLTALLAYNAIYNFHTGIVVEATEGGRVAYSAADGMGAGHVALANLTLQGMPFLWYLGVSNKRNLVKGIGLFLFVVCLYGVVISGSRGGFVGIVALAACLTYFSSRRLAMCIGGALIFLAIPLFATSGYMDYVSSIIGGSDVSGSSRIIGLRNGIEMMIKRPILGVGPGCYPVARSAWFGWGLWAHNHYGELIGELGIIGTIVWFDFLKKYFKRAWRFARDENGDPAVRPLSLAVVVATIVRLVLGMGTHSVYIFFWYMMAAVMVVLERGSEPIASNSKAESSQETRIPIGDPGRPSPG
jgi:O-antigen ligase